MTEQRQNHILRILMIAIITVMILVTCAYVAFAEEANIESQTSTEANRISTQSLPDTDDLLEEYLYHTAGEQLGNKEATTNKSPRYSRLTDPEKRVYAILKDEISQIAKGEGEGDTLIQIPLIEFLDDETIDSMDLTTDDINPLFNEDGELTEEAYSKLMEPYDAVFDPTHVVDALLFDCPYEMYWYEKTKGFRCYNPVYYYLTDLTRVFCPAENSFIRFRLTPSDAYSGDTYITDGVEWTSVDTDKTADTQTAVDNATDVVLTNKGLGDYHILRNYKDDICERVSYNDEAASGTMPYGDPWQIIYVFDDNPDTNVVCEGYAKAFKYLCDLSSFASDNIDCYLNTGEMKASWDDDPPENHMWNIVRMDDESYYLVDVTNCDEGMAGQGDGLFLRGSSKKLENKNLDEGFYVSIDDDDGISYVYSTETILNFNEDERTIATSDYDHSGAGDHSTHQWRQDIIKATPGVDGSRVYVCEICDETQGFPIYCPQTFKLSSSAYTYNGSAHKPTVTVKDSMGISIDPSYYTVSYSSNVNAGNAKATVTFKGDYFAGIKDISFIINKAANPISVKGKKVTVKYTKVKRKAQTLTAGKVLTVSKAQGKKTYIKTSGNKKISINKKTGKLTVKKGLKKGTYKIKVKVTAAGNANYKSLAKVVTCTVKVK